MMLKETLAAVARSQKEGLEASGSGIERDALAELKLDPKFALVLSGVRRCGKSTLLRQMMKREGKFCFFSFEDPRASGFEAGDFQKLADALAEVYGSSDAYFFDEVQNVPRWELFVRAMLDRGKRVAITGSNASLLSRELGTRLTGRHMRHELFPFSFGEFLKMRREKPGAASLGSYLSVGGFPEHITGARPGILQELLNDIIERDIAMRRGVRNSRLLKDMAVYLLSNVGKEFSYNSLRKTFGLGSTNTASAFVSYFEDSYILFSVPMFDFSIKKRLANPKKIYSVDNGISVANSASFSPDLGHLLENAIFLGLRRFHKNIFYYRGKGECDFVIKEGPGIAKAFQVCYDLNEDNKERELGGLAEAMEKFNLHSGAVITFDQEDTLKIGGRKVAVTPAWKWLLQRP